MSPQGSKLPSCKAEGQAEAKVTGPPYWSLLHPQAAGGAVICPAAPSFLPPRSHILLIFQMSCLRTEAKDNGNEALIRA